MNPKISGYPASLTTSLHLVIPCFQESQRIAPFLRDLKAVFGTDCQTKIMLVEDGSGAAEQARFVSVVESTIRDCPLFTPPLLLPENLGKGGAVYAGWAQHDDADWLAFVDADGSCSASETKRLIELAQRSSSLYAGKGSPPALFASRVKILGRQVDRQFKRHLMGRIYATLVSELLHIPVYDSQCGLKLVPRAAFEKISNRLSIKGFAFDADLLVNLLDAGQDVVEVPIDWHETPGGKIQLIRDSWRMFRDVLRIRGNRQPAQ